jgi:hypothetical protein
MPEVAVAQERTGWRDLALSKRHREWGFDCPIVDIDFLVVEYDREMPRAIIEYKHEQAWPIDYEGSNYKALETLGNWSGLPFFICWYSGNLKKYKPMPMNEHAKSWLETSVVMNELQYVSFLYRIRGREMPKEVYTRIKAHA